MIPQLIGTKKSKGFRAVERFCKERRLTVQTRDPDDKPLTRRELETIAAGVGGAEALVDTESKRFKERGLAWMDYDPLEEIVEDPALLRRPILRTDRGVAVDPDSATLASLLEQG